ncbi:MAG: flagellar biosynthesis protein FlhA [Actinomycetota bacterium]
MKDFKLAQAGFPAVIVLVVTVMVLPLPSSLLDLLIVANISTAVLILLVATNVNRALDFSSFPSLLLVVTLVRIGLNVSTSRAILSNGDAGQVISTFGSFVVGGSIIVGFVIFLIITLVQFVVISNGSSRVAEVTARFTLDAMPGKQMSIDADLNAGVLTDEEAKQRRQDVADESDFYGAMDGASKFVKGDAIAGLVITLVNLIGGLVVGVVQQGMELSEAVATYSLLTVGDGLVAQIPALLVSISSGLIVTRSAGDTGDLGSDVLGQFARQGAAIRSGGVVVLLMMLVPGLPTLPFLVFGGTLLIVGQRLMSRPEPVELPDLEPVDEPDEPPTAQDIATEARVEPLELDLAYDMIELVDPAQGGDLLDRVGALRRKIAGELGFVMPSIRTRDDVGLPPHTYVLRVHGVEIGRGTAPPGQILVIGDDLAFLPGEDVIEPVFGLEARWVPAELRNAAEQSGLTVVDRSALVVTHLAEIVRRRAGQLLSRSDVAALLESVEESDPPVIEDLSASGVTNGEVQSVLAALLDNGVSIRDLVRIIETISDRSRTNRAIEALVAACREKLGPALSSSHAVDGCISVVTLAPMFENALAQSLELTEAGAVLRLAPDLHEHLGAEIRRIVLDHADRPGSRVLVCSPGLRAPLADVVRQFEANVVVLSYQEIGDHLQIELIDTLAAPPLGGLAPGGAPIGTPGPTATDHGQHRPTDPATPPGGLTDDRLAHPV